MILDAWWERSTMTMTKATHIKKGDTFGERTSIAQRNLSVPKRNSTVDSVLLMQPSAECCR